jgi:hypothetical protein
VSFGKGQTFLAVSGFFGVVSALFWWVEMCFFDVTAFIFMGLQQKWGMGGDCGGVGVRTGRIPDRLELLLSPGVGRPCLNCALLKSNGLHIPEKKVGGQGFSRVPSIARLAEVF